MQKYKHISFFWEDSWALCTNGISCCREYPFRRNRWCLSTQICLCYTMQKWQSVLFLPPPQNRVRGHGNSRKASLHFYFKVNLLTNVLGDLLWCYLLHVLLLSKQLLQGCLGALYRYSAWSELIIINISYGHYNKLHLHGLPPHPPQPVSGSACLLALVPYV